MNRCVLAALSSAWFLNAAAQEIDRNIAADPNGELSISNVAGSIEVQGSDGNEVQVRGTLGANVERLDVLAEDDTIIVKVALKERERDDFRRDSYFGDNETDLRIRAPRTMSLDVSGVSADVLVRDMRGEQRISVVSGDIETQAYDAEIRVQSVSGDVEIDGDSDPIIVRASAVSGDLIVNGTAGDVRAESVSGDVEIEGATVNRVDGRSVSGDVGIRAALAPDARIDVTSTSGDIELDLRGNAAGNYRLATFSGEIYNCFGPRPADNDRRRPPGTELRFSEGRGDARIDVRTHSGDIEVCRD